MGRWQIEGLAEVALCLKRARELGWRVACAQSKDVMVRYIGRRDNPNRDPAESDFLVRRDGTIDHRVDPTWWENCK